MNSSLTEDSASLIKNCIKKHPFLALVVPLTLMFCILAVIFRGNVATMLPLQLTLSSFVGACWLCCQMNDYSAEAKIIRCGSRVTGTVLGKKERDESSMPTDGTFWPARGYYVTYSFVPGSGKRQTVTKEVVSHSLWEKLKVGDAVEIAFEVSDPATNLLVAERVADHRLSSLSFVIFLIWNTPLITGAAYIISMGLIGILNGDILRSPGFVMVYLLMM